MQPPLRRLCVALCIALCPAGPVLAHSGGHAPVYVAPGGQNTGDCSDPLAPCRTLGYALSVAGKGAEVRIAAGSYEVTDPEVLLRLASRSVGIAPGWSAGFSKPRAGVTTLIGVPPAYRELLEPLGLGVIADTKSLDDEKAALAGKLLAQWQRQKAGLSAAECAGGSAAGLACAGVDLLAHVPLDAVSARPAAGNDVWGFVDLNTGREYAIAGFDIGTAVFDVTDPGQPREIGFVGGQRTTWRDIKVYQFYDAAAGRWHAFAYVTADNVSEGLFVIDLGGLPQSIARIAYASDFTRAHNVQLANADYATGLARVNQPPQLVIAGSNLGRGAFRVYSLADPGAPAFVAAGSAVPGGSATIYTHDSAPAIVSDARAQACPDAGAWCEVLLDFNEDQIVVWDITDAAHPQPLAVRGYANASYVHSGWWSEDHRWFYAHDELDEQHAGLNTTVRVFAMDDLAVPVEVGTWTGPAHAIDHNGFVRGNRYYMANYTRGLTVLDLGDPAAPADAGFLDVYAPSEAPGFQGAWGAYPYFFSGTVAVNDIDTGLYLVRDRTLDVPQGRLGFAARSVAAEEGGIARLAVNRTGGAQGAVGVTLEVVHASAGPGDYLLPATTLSWASDDSSPRNVDLQLSGDAAAEGLERLLVRLVAPTGGATLGEVNVASVYVAEAAAAPEIGFFEPAIEASETGFGRAVVVLRRRGNAGAAASVDFTVTGATATAGDDFDGPQSGTVHWAAGDGDPVSLVFDIVDDGVAEDAETFSIALAGAAGAAIAGSASAEVTILDSAGSGVPPGTGNDGPAIGSGGRGSGAAGPALLLLLAAAGAGLRRRTGDAGRSSARDPGRSR